jgi:hypothetical protein
LACSSASTDVDGVDEEGKLSNNGLVLDLAVLDKLSTAPLSKDGLVNEEAFADLLSTPSGEELFSYLVICALGEEQSLERANGTLYAGNLGMEPQWETSSCDESCQRWISACALAHNNAFGESVTISPRGSHPALVWNKTIEQDFAIEEAAYYGNLFLAAHERTAIVCGGAELEAWSSDEAIGEAFLHGRINSGGSDELEFSGMCDGFIINDPILNEPVKVPGACQTKERGFYEDCLRDADDAVDEDAILVRVPEVITVFVK